MLRTRPGSPAWRQMKPSEFLKEYIKESDYKYFKFSKPTLFKNIDKFFISKEEVVKKIEAILKSHHKITKKFERYIRKLKESKCNP